ncbi:RagB/SusD family nutrient uptake outer membrane protein [Pedobacter sp. ISL-68]|uniref:RagB/SusD family nutrient uptake outer membrane protein n=1 Tax=unclassified Pedobacter TaxID=2628915 RepID=UPI001BE7002D|nr:MULTISPECIES: RagB/SusD family nutrient uptake outer membrane protein [unclassified Pedobacter]MBT2563639.1 RagB/SusD family nutrient uptake outer membrane protein [Pedobacter sp. ISL-64]MBT2589531.1 RagB/SusD family nutrient uptake outer membrane protein [Pedobacter sp. ISL-68]
MKKILIYTVGALLVVGNYGCKKFLNQVPDDRLTFDQMYEKKATVDRALANVYSTLPDQNQDRAPSVNGNIGPWTAASDEADYTLPNFSENVNTGAWDATSGQVNYHWQNFYRGIQAASSFMANVTKCTDCNLGGIDIANRYYNEARALRAIYYYHLVRQYGPVVLLGNDPIASDAPLAEISKPRNSMDECIDYIVSELDATSARLPATPQASEDYGHITASVADAYKIKALLTAARPLFNGNTDYAGLKNQDGKQLISQTASAAKWTRLATAAKAFLNNPNYSSYALYSVAATPAGLPNTAFNRAFIATRDVFLNGWNSEIIFGRGGDVTLYQYSLAPNHNGASGGDKGGSFLSPSQQLVDAFFTVNGLPIESDPTYTANGTSSYQAPDPNDQGATRAISNMFVNREPRFYADITYTGRKWINTSSNIITDFTNSGNAGKGAIANNDYSKTGYTSRKHLTVAGWTSGRTIFTTIRLAEIYLDYIEALQESNPSDPDILIYLNKIRTRAGIAPYGSGAGALPVPTDMRDAIRRERRVELAFELDRYFYTREWKIAETTDTQIRGLNIVQNAPGFFTPVVTENRVFQKKHYLWPIPNGEIQKVPVIVQNTGW